MRGERRAEALPGNYVEGLESLFLEHQAGECPGVGRGAEACQGTDVGGA